MILQIPVQSIDRVQQGNTSRLLQRNECNTSGKETNPKYTENGYYELHNNTTIVRKRDYQFFLKFNLV